MSTLRGLVVDAYHLPRLVLLHSQQDIDDIMLFPVKKEDSAALFNLINTLHKKVSLIITTNKSPTEWAETLDNEVLASALLDRLLYRCEVVKLSGASYRMENRKTIFKNEKQDNRAKESSNK